MPWGQEKVEEGQPRAPWPGRLPAPSPARLSTTRESADRLVDVLDVHGQTVGIDDRGFLDALPRYVEVKSGPRRRISGWAGPWLFDERWWQGTAKAPQARVQLLI